MNNNFNSWFFEGALCLDTCLNMYRYIDIHQKLCFWGILGYNLTIKALLFKIATYLQRKTDIFIKLTTFKETTSRDLCLKQGTTFRNLPRHSQKNDS